MLSLGLRISLNRQAFGLPLDRLSAAAAYSLRKLRTAYTGPAVRVRRSSDNAEADIGFTGAGDLDTTALLAHCGAGSGFVTTWYDQSGNARNATQATAGNQPRIVNAGVIETEGSRPTVQFVAGQNRNLRRTDAALAAVLCSANWAGIAVTRCAEPSLTRHVFGNRTGTGFFLRSNAGGASWLPNIVGAGNVIPFNATTTDFQIITTLVTAGQMSAGKNGGALTVGTTGAAVVPTSNELIIGGGNSGSTDWAGPISEIVIIGSALSASDRQTIERNQGAYYGITVA